MSELQGAALDAITPAHFRALRTIHHRLGGSAVNWAVTGSLGLLLQGVPTEVHDIDIQTDRWGAYEIERRLAELMTRGVTLRTSERIRSHFGAAEIGGVSVEIMGDIQKRLEVGAWDKLPNLRRLGKTVLVDGMSVPVLSLEYEYRAYLNLGRTQKAEMIRKRLDQPT